MNVPPGLKDAFNILNITVDAAFNWKDCVREFLHTIHYRDDDGENNASNSLINGRVCLSPALLLQRFENREILRGSNNAYVCCANANTTVCTVNNLLRLGVRNFSIYVSQLKVGIHELYQLLLNAAAVISDRVAFTFWIDFHVFSVLETLVKCRANKIDHVDESRLLTVGILMPPNFFTRALHGLPWQFFDLKENEHCTQLCKKHGSSYSQLYDSFTVTIGERNVFEIKNLLKLLISCALWSKAKILIYNRDLCYTETDSHYDRKHHSDNVCFPNHIGEVPVEYEEKVIVLYTAFINVNNIATLNAENCEFYSKLAYAILTNTLNTVADNDSKDDFLLGCNLTSAVGIIGVADELCHNVTQWDIEKIALMSQKASTKLYPLGGTLSSILWNTSDGMWSSFIGYRKLNEDTRIPSRRLTEWLSMTNKAQPTFEQFHHACMIDHKQNNVLIPLYSQLDTLRKICSSFFSPSPMPLVITSEDARAFEDEKRLIAMFTEILFSNYTHSCLILLPEIRTLFTASTQISSSLTKKFKASSLNLFLKGIGDALKFWIFSHHQVTKFAESVVEEMLTKHVDHLSS